MHSVKPCRSCLPTGWAPARYALPTGSNSTMKPAPSPIETVHSTSAGGPARGSAGGSRAIALGTDLAVGMAVFSALGYWMDRRAGGGVAWTLAGVFLGLVYGAYEVWKTVRGLEQETRPRSPGVQKGSKNPDPAAKSLDR